MIGIQTRKKDEMIPIIDYWIKAARSKLVKPTAQRQMGEGSSVSQYKLIERRYTIMRRHPF